MFLSRKIYDDQLRAYYQALSEAKAFQEANKGLQVSLDWLRTRVTQLEKERAVMVERFYGVKVAVPEIIATPDPFENHKFNETFSFDGMSDAEAEKQGVAYAGDGSVTYLK